MPSPPSSSPTTIIRASDLLANRDLLKRYGVGDGADLLKRYGVELPGQAQEEAAPAPAAPPPEITPEQSATLKRYHPIRFGNVSREQMRADPEIGSFLERTRLFDETAAAITDEDLASYRERFPKLPKSDLEARRRIAAYTLERSPLADAVPPVYSSLKAPAAPEGPAGLVRGAAQMAAHLTPPIGGAVGQARQRTLEQQPARGFEGLVGGAIGSSAISAPALAAGASPPGLVVASMFGAATAGSKIDEVEDYNRQIDREIVEAKRRGDQAAVKALESERLSEAQMVAVAVGGGLLEAASEYLGFAAQKAIGREAAERIGRLVLARNWREASGLASRVLGAGHVEGLEEVVSNVGQVMIDTAAGTRGDVTSLATWKRAGARALAEGALGYAGGFIGGTMLEAPAAAIGGARSIIDDRAERAAESRDFAPVADEIARQSLSPQRAQQTTSTEPGATPGTPAPETGDSDPGGAPPGDRPRKRLLTPEGVAEFARNEPELARAVATLPSEPSRSEFAGAGMKGRWTGRERAELVAMLREAVAPEAQETPPEPATEVAEDPGREWVEWVGGDGKRQGGLVASINEEAGTATVDVDPAGEAPKLMEVPLEKIGAEAWSAPSINDRARQMLDAGEASAADEALQMAETEARSVPGTPTDLPNLFVRRGGTHQQLTGGGFSRLTPEAGDARRDPSAAAVLARSSAEREPDRQFALWGNQVWARPIKAPAAPAMGTMPPGGTEVADAVETPDPGDGGAAAQPGGRRDAVPAGRPPPADPGPGAQPGSARGDLRGGLPDGATADAGAGQPGGERAGGALPPGEGSGGLGVQEAAGGDVEKHPRSGGQAEPGRGGQPARGPAERGPLTENDLDHFIEESDVVAPSTDSQRFESNVEAIELLRALEDEGRNPSPDEKRALARYTGWGWGGEIFNEAKPAHAAKRDRLKKLLTDEEYASARASTINAHYTSIEIIRPMWELARRLGFRGGRVLEPGAGVGHFFGTMPRDLHEGSALIGVELDQLTGRILRKLYPEADVRVEGFEKTPIANNSVDLAIGNVPFGDFRVAGATDHPTLLLHYFFARALDKVRPGGVVIFITSDGTMDKSGSAVRRALGEKADLVGAIRLPNNAFKSNAGTEVTTDIVVLRKRDGRDVGGEPWTSLAKVGTGTFRGPEGKMQSGEIWVNEYFAAHPENVLGEHTLAGTMYARGDYAAVAPPGQNTAELLERAIERFPTGILEARTRPDESALAPEKRTAVAGEKEGSYVERDGGVFQIVEGEVREPEWKKQKNYGDDWGRPITEAELAKRAEIAPAWIALKGAVVELLRAENDPATTDAQLAELRRRLNDLYDAFRKKHGTLKRPYLYLEPAAFMEDDPEYALVVGIEDEKNVRYSDKGRKSATYEKGKIFRQRLRPPDVRPESASSVEDAISISLGYHGRIIPGYVAELLGIDEERAHEQILESGRAFIDPETGRMELAELYLSGNVRRKLSIARDAGEGYEPNVAALEGVQPADLPLGEISFTVSSRWIPPAVFERFAEEGLGFRASISYARLANAFTLGAASVTDRSLHDAGSTAKAGAPELFGHAINGTLPTFTKNVGTSREPKLVRDEEATRAAQVAIGKMARAFETWARTAPSEADGKPIPVLLEDTYNQQFNSYRPPVFDGSYLALPGITDEVFRTPHRMNAIARVIHQRRGMLAHGVGSGKTYTLIASAMELKRLGLARKPMVVVQKQTVGQFAEAVRKAYPEANVLVASEKSFSKANRNRMMAQIALNDYDMVIVTHPQFDRLPNRPEEEAAFLQDQIAEMLSAIDAARSAEGKNAPTVKELEKAKRKLEGRLASAMDAAKKHSDQTVFFQDMGVDFLFIDEAHAYKRAMLNTRMVRVKGVPSGNSQRALAMEVKGRSIQNRQGGGRGVVMATGTPITNTIAEGYVMLRLTAPDVLEDFDIRNFDEFAHTFGRASTRLEFTHFGTFKRVSRFNKFTNGPELQKLMLAAFDVAMGNKELGLKVPEIIGDSPELVLVEPTPATEDLSRWIIAIGEGYEKSTQKRDISWVPIVTMSTGMAAALDPRLISRSLPDDPNSKVNVAVRRIAEIYERSARDKGTQLVFLDRFAPVKASTIGNLSAIAGSAPGGGSLGAREGVQVLDDETTDEDDELTGEELEQKRAKAEVQEYKSATFNLYHDIRDKLIAAGVQPDEIAIVHDFPSDKARDRLFNMVNAGQIRILLGSTERMGVGVNVQERLIAEHHLDPPRSMTPAMMEQRDGRIIRQGARLGLGAIKGQEWPGGVHVVRYGTERSMDTGIYQLLESKQRFIVQFLKGKFVGREFDDAADEVSASFARIKAQLTGDARVMRFADLDGMIRELDGEKAAFENEKSAAVRRAHEAAGRQKSARADIEHFRAVRDWLAANFEADPENLTVSIDGAETRGSKEASAAIDELWASMLEERKRTGAFRVRREILVNGVGVALTQYEAIKGTAAEATPEEKRRDIDIIDPVTSRLIATARPTTGRGVIDAVLRWASQKNIDGIIAGHERDLAQAVEVQKAAMEKQAAPWERAEEYETLVREYAALEAELTGDGAPDHAKGRVAAGTVLRHGEQDRAARMRRQMRRPLYAMGASDPGSPAARAQEYADVYAERSRRRWLGLKGPALASEEKVRQEQAARGELPEEVHRRLAAARGVPLGSKLEAAVAKIIDAWRAVTRPQKHLPANEEFAAANELFRLFKDAPGRVRDEVARTVGAIVTPLDYGQYRLFENLVIAENLIASVQRGEPLRFGFQSLDQVEAWRDSLERSIDDAQDPEAIRSALEQRRGVVAELVDRLVEYDLLPEGALEHAETYFHQHVLGYLQESRLEAMRDPRRRKASFQRRRATGTVGLDDEFFDYNTSYVEAEFKWMAEAFSSIEREKFLRRMAEQYDVLPGLKAEARKLNYAAFVGGDANVKRLAHLRDLLSAGGLDRDERAKLVEEIDTLDPSAPQRRKVAGMIRKLEKMAAAGEIDMGPYADLLEYDPELDDTGIDTDDPRWFGFLRYISQEYDGDEAGNIAKGVFNGFRRIREMQQEALGSEYLTWERLARRDPKLEAWQPQPGNVFYRAFTLPERVAEAAQAALAEDIHRFEIDPEDLRQATVMGGPRKPFVFPREIVAELDELTRDRGASLAASIEQDMVRMWKVWTLLNPKRAVPYMLRNVTGDVDPIIGGAPEVLAHAKRATGELFHYYRSKGRLAMSDELRLARDLGVIGASMTATEIPELRDLEVFRRLYDAQGGNPAARVVEGYFERVKRFNEFREATLRYAAFLHFFGRLRAGKPIRHYGGARKKVVDALARDLGEDVAAAHLSRNLLGDYGNMTVFGNWLRRNLIPFWSWQEINLRRYPRLVVNALEYGRDSGHRFAGAAMGGAALARGAFTAFALSRLAALYGALWAWNNLVWPDKEHDLGHYDRANPHLLVCRNADGSVRVFRNVGAVGDLLEWVGLNDAMSLMPMVASGQMGVPTLLEEMAKAPLNKLYGGLRPEKALLEAAAGISLFPDVFTPRRTDDRLATLLNTLGVADEYRGLRGLIAKDGNAIRPHYWQRWLIGVADPRRTNLSTLSSLREQFLRSKGQPVPTISSVSPFARMREAAFNGDFDDFVAARRRYVEGGRDYSNFASSLRFLDPIGPRLNDELEREFVEEFLNDDQRRKLDAARDTAANLQVMLYVWWRQAEQLDAPGADVGREEREAEMARRALALARPRPLRLADRQEWFEEHQAARSWFADRGIAYDDVAGVYRRYLRSRYKDPDTIDGYMARFRRSFPAVSAPARD